MELAVVGGYPTDDIIDGPLILALAHVFVSVSMSLAGVAGGGSVNLVKPPSAEPLRSHKQHQVTAFRGTTRIRYTSEVSEDPALACTYTIRAR